nr:zinc finger and SCAN domain-containing protein 32-like [Caretta caretta]XP_048672657.1 zinc finger and SCAN domain-containing protein 32-like [Caretta caretta]XP_048672658.1 zinc finger and SCAN domain-containing protein 32-like [Caretta caretta]XP_048672659.1 zinc finger and SCAN domain-containing protein 32-like [Caretta caretta]
MQSSSAQVTMMESQNRKRAPAWTEREVRDLIAVWGEESVLSELRSSFRNAKTFVKISQGMKDRGHNRDPKQCRVKLKELRQAYQKTREANSRSGSEPQTCRFYDELHAILGGSATTTPAVLFDSFNGDGGNTEAGFGDEEDDDDEEVVDSSQQASGETGFPRQPGTVSHPRPGASTRTHPRLPPGPSRRRRDLCCMCFNDHRIFSFPEASEA